ncbi:GNAT family N-acetyltransferase [Rhodobacter sp. HX-7-19]|uniref:GNAT family N-acetyltransferase n=1 Tax=Paragemmobacter kunshanensis TaxID=2583234 RepID=A0A6M1U4H4_9RHOB|nr:GNAT family N-acetyltransferase [Rhodobacter kunshanensis]NGQ91125.1 GNAT family N-acetyltransferase [Rhodobacter kunshanensis]
MDHTITLRRARLSDLAGVDRLLQRSYPRLLKADYPPSTLVLCLPIIARAKPDLLQSGRYFVAEDEAGHLIGAGGWSGARPQGEASAGEGAVDAPGAEIGHVRHVAVDPDRLRAGIGRAVMGEVFVDALRHGIRWLDCLSTRTAVPFYQSLGFRVLHEVEIGLAPGIVFPAVRVMRQIAP